MKQRKFWLKIIGFSILLHIALIIVSILEVTIYSYLIVPNKDEAFYQAHAQISGPWISGIFGSLFIFMLVKRYIKKNNERHLTYAVAFSLTYIIIDILILLPFNMNWSEHFPIFFMANGAKVAASFLSYFIYKPATRK